MKELTEAETDALLGALQKAEDEGLITEDGIRFPNRMMIKCRLDKLLPTTDLLKIQHPKNPNEHPDSQIKRLAEILKYQGIRHPIVISNLSGFITKGHGRLMAAIHNEWQSFPVEYQDYDNEDQEYADIVADNAIASWAELNLAKINAEIPSLGPFDINMLGIQNFVLEPADKYGDKDADATPEIRKTDIKRGDLFILGTHRLACGDSTVVSDVERLMNGEKADMVYTDPPYGMNLDTDYSQIKGSKNSDRPDLAFKKHRPVIGDKSEFNFHSAYSIFESCKEQFWWGADYYCQQLPKDGGFLVWDKTGGHDSLMDAGFGSNFELCWTKQKHKRDICRHTWKAVAGMKKEDGSRVHPTQKPVGLAEWFFSRWGKDKTNIVDLYLGSGSTFIACEKTNRKCFGMEIDPQYCQVIIDRWEKFTGQKAIKLDDAKPKIRKKVK